MERSENVHSFINITVPSTSWNTGLDTAIMEINKNFSLKVGYPFFGRLAVQDTRAICNVVSGPWKVVIQLVNGF